jgi:uncharacterized membrane protein
MKTIPDSPRHPLAIAGLWAITLLFATFAHAQCNTLLQQLTPDPGVDLDGFGKAIAISADGNTAVIGAPQDSSNAGAVYVFLHAPDGWHQDGPKLASTDAPAQSGYSVAVSADGGRLLAGAPGGSGGIVCAYSRQGGAWVLTDRIYPPAGGGGGFGTSVALSADGITALVGAPTATGGGRAYVYVDTGAGWTTQGDPLIPSDGGGGAVGTSVSLSADGNTALVGAPSGYYSPGYVAFFTRGSGLWYGGNPVNIFDGLQQHPAFGSHVALSANGAIAAIQAGTDNGGTACYILNQSGGVLARVVPQQTPTPTSSGAIAISADGSTVAVTCTGDNNGVGSTAIFSPSGGGAWLQRGMQLAPPVGSGLGQAVALGADGLTVLVAGNMSLSRQAVWDWTIPPTSTVTSQPANMTVAPGGTALFSVSATSTSPPLSYQWRRNGSPLTNGMIETGASVHGAATAALTVTSITMADNGTALDCIVTDSCGSVLSNQGALTVRGPSPSASMVALGYDPVVSGAGIPLVLSGDGTVAAGYAHHTNLLVHAIRWTAAAGVQSLGILPGDQQSKAFGISRDGSVIVGYSSRQDDQGNYFDTAFRWTVQGHMQPLPIPPGAIGSVARGITPDGSIIVGYTEYLNQDGEDLSRPFRWTEATGLQELAFTGDGAGAGAISDDGTVIVGSNGNSFFVRPARWVGGVQQLLDLIPCAGSGSALNTSADGSVIVGGTGGIGGCSHPWRWSVDRGMEDLGTLPGSGGSTAFGVSADGSLVVGSGPFLWTRERGLQNLNDYFPQLGVDLTGWRLGTAYAITPDGSVLAGSGSLNGFTQGWIARIRPPCATADFDHDGSVGTDADIESFFACLSGDCCPTCGSADFNGDGALGDAADIAAFFRVLAGGGC